MVNMPATQSSDYHYHLRVSSASMEKLKYIAFASGRSINKEIEQIIFKHIVSWEAVNGPIPVGNPDDRTI